MSLIHHSDAELIQAYVKGQDLAIETLIVRYKDKVYTSIFVLVKDKFLAEDIFQETFLKVIKTIKEGRYNEQGKFLQWVIRVGHNLCMDHFRRSRQNIPVSLPDGKDISYLFTTHDAAPDNIEKRQVHSSVRNLIEQLPEEQREVIVLRMYSELSFKEIADLTGVSINTSLGRMRYALLNLRKMICEKQLVLR